jgi:hypothetical protein
MSYCRMCPLTIKWTSGPHEVPRRLHKPRVHWFIGLSERNERRPPNGASHTGQKKKQNKKRGAKPFSGCPGLQLFSQSMRKSICEMRATRPKHPAGTVHG